MHEPRTPGRLAALLTAVFVTFLWSTSWVLIKLGLSASLPALPFAGMRYGLAALCLLPFALGPSEGRRLLRAVPWAVRGRLLVLGLVYIAVAQGAQFAALGILPAATVSLVLNLTPALVALASVAALGEPPTPRQWVGVLVASAGTLLYFGPQVTAATSVAGMAAALVSLAANAGGSLLGRSVNRDSGLPPLIVTFASLSTGAAALLAGGIALQGVPLLSGRDLLIVGWLAVVNTALAFTLWNRTLRVLSAVESSVVNGLMLPQIALLAVVVLGEPLGGREVAGLLLVGAGSLTVQLPRSR